MFSLDMQVPVQPMPVDYHLATGKTTEELMAKVTPKLQDGWVLHGETFHCEPEGFCQAIVKIELRAIKMPRTPASDIVVPQPHLLHR